MTTVLDVAAYILQKAGKPMSAMKLQKLAYYCQAWHATWTDEPLFAEPFQAWANGPVSWTLYDQHRGRYSVSEGDLNGGSPDALTPADRFSIDAVVDTYGRMSAAELSLLTHMERPWIEARGGLASGQRSESLISVDSMQRYYSQVAADPNAQLVSDLERPAWA